MSLFYIFLVIVIIGVALWAVNTYIPMDAQIKKILNIAVVIGVILWLLNIAGVFGFLKGVHV